jgi:hypothetical protein
MARLVILDDADFVAMSNTLGTGGNVILLNRATLRAAGIDERLARERAREYDCGGDPELWVDLVGTPEHYFIGVCREAVAEATERPAS